MCLTGEPSQQQQRVLVGSSAPTETQGRSRQQRMPYMNSDTALSALVSELAKITPNGDTIRTLAAALAAEPEFAERMYMARRGPVTPTMVAQSMLALARTPGRSSEDSVAWLRKIPAVGSGVGRAVKALYGIQCSERVALSDNVFLVPIMELPDTDTRKWVLDEHDRANQGLLVNSVTMPPASALYRAGTIEPLLSPEPVRNSPVEGWFRELDQAALLLAIAPKVIPSEAAHWLQFDDPDVELIARGSVGRLLPDISPSVPSETYHSIAPEFAAGLVAKLQNLVSETDRARVLLALERLIRSRIQQHPGNRAIDIAIALEVLFKDGERGHISEAIRRRAVGVVNPTEAARVQKCYSLRNCMVHTGKINETAQTANEIVETADSVCRKALERILTVGHVPSGDEWLAGGSLST